MSERCGVERRFRSTKALAVTAGVLALVCWGAARGSAMEYFVSPKGNDAWSGRYAAPRRDGSDGPFRTLARAARAVKPGDVCTVRGGTYRETLRPAASGEPGRPIVFRAYRGETPLIVGSDLITGWREEGDGVWSAPMEWDLEDQNQLFADGQMLTEARWPNNTGTLLQVTRAVAAAGSATTITDPNLPGGPDAWKGALIWCAANTKWFCWTGRVTGFDAAAKTLTFECASAREHWYTPNPGSEYVLMGVRAALDAPGEWWYDRESRRVLLIPPAGKNPNDFVIEAKRRLHAIDLSGRAHIHLVGLHFRAGGILTDDHSSHLELRRLKGEYVAHSYVRDTSSTSGVLVHGDHHLVHSCELAYSSGSVLSMRGNDHRLINCYIHDGNYAGTWSGTVSLSGRRHLVSHNTIRHSGRDLLSIHGLSESVIQYNDLSHAGWLTHDLGMTYGHNTDFANTEIHHNWVHDNQAKGLAMGIYFDHLSHNAIVHHNAIWNITGDAIRINNPSYFNLVYNNTCYRTFAAGGGKTTSFDHSNRQDTFASRWINNILNVPLALPENTVVAHNLEGGDARLVNPDACDFRLQPGSPAVGAGMVLPGVAPRRRGQAPDLGAYPFGEAPWKAGHDFNRPPRPEPRWRPANVAWMNLVRNACFETGTLEGWATTDSGRAQITPGNGWGNGFAASSVVEPTGTSSHELRLGGGVDGVAQHITGLRPNTPYTLSAWVKVSSEDESVCVGVRDAGGPEVAVSTSQTRWTRLVLEFRTGPRATGATVFLRKTTPGPGYAWCDNVGLPRTP